jgi:hypothetical protein
MSRIFITGDCHFGGDDTSRFTSKKWPEGKTLTRDDFVIIVGDVGLVWYPKGTRNAKQDEYYQKWITKKPWTTLFIDGNHENHDMLDELPLVPMFGDEVGKVRKHLYHLKRGKVYTINGKTFFCMGGAESIDKGYRVEFKSWWRQEIPSKFQEDQGLVMLEAYNNEVDYILTHTAPSEIVKVWRLRHNIPPGEKDTDPTIKYLNHLEYLCKYKHWFNGHFHDNFTYKKHTMIYRKLIELTDDYTGVIDEKSR